MKLYNIYALRKMVMPLLKKFDRTISMKHPWIKKEKVIMSLFKHKGYWYHGKKREKETMLLFKKIINPGSTVVEVGGHIGFISLWFEHLISPDGRVFVFEPGSNNLPYIKKNIGLRDRIILIEKAVGSSVGNVNFYEDDLTGQNNSVVENFEGYKSNAAFAGVDSTTKKITVSMTTLDSEFKDIKIDFIKIDIEGGELDAISGAEVILSDSQPALMVEIQANERDLYLIFSKYDYVLFDPLGNKLTTAESLKGNVFCLHKNKHKDLINSIFHKLDYVNDSV